MPLGPQIALVHQPASPACADSLVVSTGRPDGLMAMASRPGTGGKIEIEAADDFILTQPTSITGRTFTGLLLGSGVGLGHSKRYHRVLPRVSQRFGVPTQRQRSGAREFPFRRGLQFAQRRHGRSEFIAKVLSNTFTANNSVLNGINEKPNQQTLGEGPVTSQEVISSFSISPDLLPSDHYFFVPQVQLSDGEFMWLSVPKPIVSGTLFTPDLQAWIRNEELAPDWLRVGTDIVGGSPAPTFNASFSLDGVTATPEPSSLLLLGAGLLGITLFGRNR